MLTAEQKEARKGKITSSIAAGALGLHPLMSPIDAWLRARGEGPDIDTKATERGNKLESVILDYPAEKLGLIRRPAEFRSAAPWMGDSADALYVDAAGVPVLIGEGKSASMGVAAKYGEEETDEIPESTLIQSHWHLLHWPEVDRCAVPVLVGGYRFEFRLYYVDRDREFEGILTDDLAKWHRDYVVTGVMPPATALDTESICDRYRKHAPGKMIPATAQLAELAARKTDAAERKKAAEAEEEEAKNLIRQLLGDAEGCKAEWGSISWKNTKDVERFDREAFAAAHPELLAKYTTTAPGSRVLRVTLKKEKV